MPLAEKTACEWNDIIGGTHASTDPSEMQAELRKFHTLPETQRLRHEGQEYLVKPIRESKVLRAIDRLPRDKAGGIPLRKKGDSANAMDYRPISLLNTAYKILGRIYAERIHSFLPRIISHAQQGFVRGDFQERNYGTSFSENSIRRSEFELGGFTCYFGPR
ncbi:LINE-1 Reverse transcriptase [Phytophthora megakarya]|uniref:LINE-1 Reverse transcriptase n=1 Tax=Phytophthora megakarya TaxID=4795 RepID=A0A225VBL1_9STRA|nr:LINE-1 Reverse transcriptase [Phytophthora megakarya]